MYSNPPVYGARLVTEILSDDALAQEWYGECKVCKGVIVFCARRLRSPTHCCGAVAMKSGFNGQMSDCDHGMSTLALEQTKRAS